jgi:hypothetical protein
MFIPSTKRFEMNPINNMLERRFIIQDNLFLVSIVTDKWEKDTGKKVSRWFNQHKNGTGTFPYGKVQKVSGININDVIQNACEFCGKKLRTLRTKRKHMENCKHKVNVVETKPSEAVTLQNTRIPIQNGGGHTTINNNNITINNTYVQICDFGNENQKWLTKDILKCLYLDRKTAIKQLIRNRHFNDKFPENQNIRLDNKNNMNKRLQVFSKGKWRVRETKPVIDLAFTNTHEIIVDLLNIDDPPYDDDHQAQIIKEFQSTDKFRSMYTKLLRKWDDFGECLKDEDKEFQEYWEYIKTLLLDRKLLLDQQQS